MPGVFGGCAVDGDSVIHPSVLDRMSSELCVEDGYRVLAPRPGSRATIGAIDAGVRHGLAACRDFPESQVAVAIYGELYAGPARGSEPAPFLADWYTADRSTATRRAAELDGSYVIAIHDYRDGALLLINDHTASRPIYYTITNGGLWFAPELRGLSCLDGFDHTLSLGCLVSFLVNGTWMSDATLYANVRSLPQASTLLVRDGRVHLERYWVYDFDEAVRDEGLDAYMRELAPLLRRAVAKRLDALPDRSTMVVPISGGYDSRGILACVRELHDGPIRTVTWGTGEDDPEADGYVGRRVAERLGTQHSFLTRTGTGSLERDVVEMVRRLEASTDDPMNHRAELTVIKRIRHLGVTDLFRGDKTYGYHGPVESDAEALGSVGVVQAKDIGHVLALMPPSVRKSAHAEYDELVQQLRGSTALEDPSNRKDYYFYSGLLLHLLHRSSYYKFGVLDVKLPWLDMGILEFYKRVPIPYRMDKLLYIRTVDWMFPQLRDVPYARRHSLEDWASELRTDGVLRDFVRSVLLERRNAFDELVEPDPQRRFVEACLADRVALPAGTRTVQSGKELVRRLSPALYRRLKRRLMPVVPVPQASPVPLLFRMVIAKLWFDERPTALPPRETVG